MRQKHDDAARGADDHAECASAGPMDVRTEKGDEHTQNDGGPIVGSVNEAQSGGRQGKLLLYLEDQKI